MKTAFGAAAPFYDQAAALAQETHLRLLERLDYVKINPACMVDIGCATGDGVLALQERYPHALAIGLDYARPMLDRLGQRAQERGLPTGVRLHADARQLPLASGCVDLLWSNLVFHWSNDLTVIFRECARVLAPGGLLTFCLLGPDTLAELRGAGAKGLPDFPDMHVVGDALVAAGLAEPVLDRDHITLCYQRRSAFLRDQRHLGVRDAFWGAMNFRSLRPVLRNWAREDQGYPAGFEICFGLAWKPDPAAPTPAPVTTHPLRRLRR